MGNEMNGTPEESLSTRTASLGTRATTAQVKHTLPAAAFVASCARRILTPEAQSELAASTGFMTDEDWMQVLYIARAGRVAPLVYYHAAREGLLSTAPSGVAASLRDDYCRTLVQNRRLRTVLTTLLEELGAEGVPVLTLKGLALAHRYYGDAALRPMADIDLLVPRKSVAQASRVLRRLGYAPPSGNGRPTGFNAQTHAVLDFMRANSPQVELHWELFNHPTYRAGIPSGVAWSRAGRINLLGHTVLYLASADELRYLCVHFAAEHRLEPLIWAVDIAELVGALPASWDWACFVEETIAARLAKPVALSLRFCQEQLHLQLPDGVLDALSDAGQATAECEAWIAARSPYLTSDWVHAHIASTHSPLEWAIFLRGVLLPRLSALKEVYGPTSCTLKQALVIYLRHSARAGRTLLRALLPRLRPERSSSETCV